MGLDIKLTSQYVFSMPQAAAKLEVLPRTHKEKKTARMVIAGLAALLACAGAAGWMMYTPRDSSQPITRRWMDI